MGVAIKKVVTSEELQRIKEADYIELHLTTSDGNLGDVVKCWTQKYFDREDE